MSATATSTSPIVTSTWPPVIQSALAKPSGARYFRCALQINPLAYIKRHAKELTTDDEEKYNQAIVDACLENGIEVIAVTDHYRVRSAEKLVLAARSAGIHVFPGFEACSKDGVHFLCLFDPQRSTNEIDRIVGDCGIHADDDPSPVGNYDVDELLDKADDWKCIFVAAHVAAKSGLLTTLHGQSRINA